MTISNVNLDAIRKRAEAATKGPWYRGEGYEQSKRGNYVASESNGLIICAEQDDTDCVLSTEDAEFIAKAREDVPALLAEVERLKEKLAYISELSEDFYEQDYVDENGVIVMKVSDSLAHHRSTIQEIFIISSEEVDEDGEGME